MPGKTHREGRLKVEVQLKTSDREALGRYCNCQNISLTQFVTNRIREYERKMLSRLGEEQREAYLAGELIWAEMSDEEKAAFRAPRPAILSDETDEQLTRLLTLFFGVTKADIVAFLMRGLEDRYTRIMTPDEKTRYFAGDLSIADAITIRERFNKRPPKREPEPAPMKLDPDLAQRLMPVPEPEDVPS